MRITSRRASTCSLVSSHCGQEIAWGGGWGAERRLFFLILNLGNSQQSKVMIETYGMCGKDLQPKPFPPKERHCMFRWPWRRCPGGKIVQTLIRQQRKRVDETASQCHAAAARYSPKPRLSPLLCFAMLAETTAPTLENIIPKSSSS